MGFSDVKGKLVKAIAYWKIQGKGTTKNVLTELTFLPIMVCSLNKTYILQEL